MTRSPLAWKQATLLVGREGARASWRIKDLEETWQGRSQDLETMFHNMTNLLGDMRKLLDKKDRKIAEQSARLDAIEEYLRSKDPRAFHRSSQRDDSVDDEGLLLLTFACSLVEGVDRHPRTRLSDS